MPRSICSPGQSICSPGQYAVRGAGLSLKGVIRGTYRPRLGVTDQEADVHTHTYIRRHKPTHANENSRVDERREREKGERDSREREGRGGRGGRESARGRPGRARRE